MKFFYDEIKNFKFNYSISEDHLLHLCQNCKLVLTYHPTSAQIYSKYFNKPVIEYGEYDQKIENKLNGQARYFESVDKRIKFSKEELENTIIRYLNNELISKVKNNLPEDNLSNLLELMK